MNFAVELMKWALAHPYLTTILSLTAVGGVTALAVNATNKASILANHAIDKDYVVEVGQNTFKFGPNTRAIQGEC